MRFSTYAEVVSASHPATKEYADGLRKQPGSLLRDVLRETGGRYQAPFELPGNVRATLRSMAKLTKGDHLTSIADTGSVMVSLEHLRGLDPDSTRIVYGCRLDREPEDGHLPGLDL